MQRAGKYSLITASTLVAIIAVALLYLQFADLNIWIENIERKISESSGYDVAINGTFDLDIGSETAARVSSITISKPSSSSAAPLLSVTDFHVSLNTWSLLSGPVRIINLSVSDADLELQVDSNGVNNWQPDTMESDDSGAGEAPLFDQIRLENVRVSFSDGSSLAAAASNRATLNHAVLSIIDERIDLIDSRIALDAGSIDLKGQIDFAEANKPKVVATLFSPNLEFASSPPEDEVPAAEPGQSGETDSGKVFSDEPLDESWLDALDLNLDIMVQQLSVGTETVEELTATVAIADGALNATPIVFAKGDGKVVGEVSLAPVDDNFSLDLSIEVQQVRLVALASEGQDPDTVPPLDLKVDFAGSGRTMHEIAAASSGKLSGRQHSGLINMQDSGFLFSDIVTSVFRTINPLAESEPFAELECSIIEVSIDDGVVTIDELASQLDRLMIIGSGNINLDTEELNLTIRTKTREGLGLSLGGVVNSLLAVGGTISEPSLTIDPAGSVTTAGAAVATGGLSVLAKGLWDRLSAEADICSEAEN